MTGEPPEPGDPIAAWRETRSAAKDFENLGDADKVAFTQNELRAASEMLDELLRRHDALRTQVDDPGGLVRFTLGNDGRLLELFVHDAIGQLLDNLGFETLVNSLLEAGNRGVQAALDDFREHGFDES